MPADREGVLEVKRVSAQWGFITSQMTHHSIILPHHEIFLRVHTVEGNAKL